ncbi:MAG: hypothetical protein HGB03_03970 [Candidatus Yonathbacteria bacterium]|nr:hypothetical protein [Candidatus Yonathbacteria bacterium]NTW47611.1 hypothetical protein [Candidatus Yonathbacteria bacterium]
MADPIFTIDSDTITPVSPNAEERVLSVPGTETSTTNTKTADTYREAVAPTNISLKEPDPLPVTQSSYTKKTSVVLNNTLATSDSHSSTPSSDPFRENVTPSTSASQKEPSSSPSGESSLSVPDTSIARELRTHQERSPIERGPAPHLQAIKEGLAREKELLKPEEIIRPTEPGDPLFAADVMASQHKSPEEIAADEARTKEATARGEKHATEAGEKTLLRSLRTFESDVAEAMRSQKPSMVQSVLAEHRISEEKAEVAIVEKKKNNAFVYGAIALLILGTASLGVGGWYWYTQTFSNGETSRTTLEVPALFSTEGKKEISANGLEEASVRNAIKNTILNTDMFIDSISQLYVTEQSVGLDGTSSVTVVQTERFLSLIGSSMPSWLARSFGPIYELGVHVWNGNQGFLVFTTTNDLFDNAFSGMLKWEPSMARDLIPMFGISVDQSVFEKQWEDVIIKNRDVRSLKDMSGNIVLLYTFYDKETLIIATSPDTMDEIVNRIIQEKRK